MKTQTVAIVFLVALTASTGAPTPVSAQDKRPNILLILGDDMGFSDIGAFGSEVSTPHLDVLAKNGVMFTNFHVGATCSPTRSMLLTGVDNHRNGLGTMDEFMLPNQKDKPGYEGVLNRRVVTIPSLLQAAGYYTCMAGKWHLGHEKGYRPFHRGFTSTFALMEGGADNYSDKAPLAKYGDHCHFTENGKSTKRPNGIHSNTLYANKVIEFLKKNTAKKKPFFAYLSFQTAHWPHQAPKEFRDKYRDTYKSGWDKIRAKRITRMKQLGIVSKDAPVQPRFPKTAAWSTLTKTRQEREAAHMAVFAGMIEHMDHEIGRVLTHLRRSGQFDNTIIIFLTDNGPDFSQPNLDPAASEWFQKMYPVNDLDRLGLPGSFVSYGPQWAQVGASMLLGFKVWGTEGGLRVPLIVHYPERYRRRKIHEFSHVNDLAATILDATGTRHPGTNFQGRKVFPLSDKAKSLIPLLQGKSDKLRGTDEWVGYELLGSAAVFKGDYAAVRVARYLGNPKGQWRLYNIRTDPSQTQDLSMKDPKRLLTMTEHYREYSRVNGLVEMPADFTQQDLLKMLRK